MSSVLDKREEDAVRSGLMNQIVLRRIFSCLELKDLKHCRLVDKFWGFEAGCYMREFRECRVNLATDNSCSKLRSLNELLLSQIPFIPIMNSLQIRFRCHNNCELKEPYHELLQNLKLKYLDISWNCGRTCTAAESCHALLSHNLCELESLILRNLPGRSVHFRRPEYSPRFPKLQVLHVGFHISSAYEKDYVLKLINGAPNLKKLKGIFKPKTLQALPIAIYPLLDNFLLVICSDEEESDCLKLAEAGPELSSLHVGPPHHSMDRYMRSFLHVCEKLLASSRKSLVTLGIHREIMSFCFRSCPPLVNLKALHVVFVDDDNEILSFLRSINYAKLLPSLGTVTLKKLHRVRPRVSGIPASFNNTVSSTTVKHLTVMDMADFSVLTIGDLSQIFPQLSSIKIQSTSMAARAVPFGDLWACWPQLEFIDTVAGERIGGGNLDAEFLGINPEEVEILGSLNDESLEKINIVPIRPSVLTMKRLKILKIPRALLVEAWGWVPVVPGLSALTKILAFNKMAASGIKLEFVGNLV